jgi:hypothetical protein
VSDAAGLLLCTAAASESSRCCPTFLFAFQTTDFLHFELPMSPEWWRLVRPLIAADALPPGEVAAALAEALANCVIGKKTMLPGLLGVGDSGADFDTLARLCPEGGVLGEKLLARKGDAEPQPRRCS